MRIRVVLGVLLGVVLAAGWLLAEDIIWYRDGRGTLTGQYVQVVPDESLSVTGSVTITDSVSVDSPIAVTGTFWQETQPVSATDLDIRALSSATDSVAVTGTFWQTTQPVSIATMPTTPVTGSVTVAATDLDIRALDSGTDSVSAAVSNWPGTQTVDGTVGVSGTVAVQLSDQGTTDTPLVVEFAAQAYDEVLTDTTLTDTATAYSYTLPGNTIWYEIKARTAHAFRFARSEAGLGTAYRTVAAGEALRVPVIPGGTYSGSLWFQSDDQAGLVLEIRVGRKED
jgi:hypothetical protein